MARPTIQNIKGIGDAMVSNLWDVYITKPVGVSASAFDDIEAINFRAVSAELPKRSGNSLEINIRGHKVKQPGDYDYSGQITLTLIETEKGEPIIHELIRAWREQIIETNTNWAAPTSEIKTTAVLRRLNRQNQPMPGLTWILTGVYLEDYELGDMAESGDIIQPTLTLSYDYFYEDATGPDGAHVSQ